MGVAIPQVVSEDRAGGAQIIDGGLRFDSSKSQYLSRTFSSGNLNTWTWSGWIKKNLLDSGTYWSNFFGAGTSANYGSIGGYINSADDIGYGQINSSSQTGRVASTALYRDTSAWYHLVVSYDLSQTTAADRVKLYINGSQITALASTTYPNQNAGNSIINSNVTHYINGRFATYFGSDQFSQWYFIDGQALDPSYFGFTDPLTNTWRPKKLSSSVAFGTNGFYLPFDGSAPIGQDQSGRGNNWTPVNFGGSTTLDKATGALPILNTDGGGKVARVGVRTDSNASSLVLALPLVGIKSDFSNAINSGTSNKAVTVTGAVASSSKSNFYGGSWYFDGTGDYIDTGYSIDNTFAQGNYTIEFWFYSNDDQSEKGLFGVVGGQYGIGMRHFGSADKTLKAFFGASSLSVALTNRVQDRWIHVAMVKSGTTGTLYVDGVNQGTVSTGSPTLSTSNLYIGTYYDTSYSFNGYVQDFRVYSGLAKYTSNFIPASTDPDIVPDSPSGVSYSSNVALVPSTDGAVAFDGSSQYLSLSYSSDLDFGTGDFTLECFAYYAGSEFYIFGTGASGAMFFGGRSGKIGMGRTLVAWDLESDVILATNTWYHLAYCRSGTTLRLFVNGINVASATNSTSYTLSSSTAQIGKEYGSAYIKGFISNFHIVKGTALYTANFTPPTAPISSVANTKLLCCKSNRVTGASDIVPTSGINDGTIWSEASTITYDGSPDTTYTTGQVYAMFDGSTSTAFGVNNGTTAKFVNIVFPSAITLTTSLRVYAAFRTGMQWKVNGSNVSSSGVSHPNTGWQTLTGWSSGTISSLRCDVANGNALEIYAIEIDGVILRDPLARFGNAVASNFNPFTANIKTIRGLQSGYCTLNPLISVQALTLVNGNLETSSPGAAWRNAKGTFAMTTGKWYWEHTVPTTGASDGYIGGVATDAADYSSSSTGVWGRQGTTKYSNGSSSTPFGSTTSGDILGFAFNADTGKLWVAQNGIWVGDPIAGTSESWSSIPSGVFPYVAAYNQVNKINFGQKPFKFPPPAGFQPLTLANTPRPTIVRPDQFVGVTTYKGNGSNLAVNVGFQPDFVWCKIRTPNAYNHTLLDSVRGFTKSLSSSMTVQEYTEPTGPVAITPTGFTLNGDVTYVGSVNQNNSDYVAWCWKAGGNSNLFNINGTGYSTASAAGLTAGTITPTGASVNTKSGFSILSWTGNTGQSSPSLSHGLGANPKFMIFKNRDSSVNWFVWHGDTKSYSAGYKFEGLNTSGTGSDASLIVPSFTTSTISLYNNTDFNGNYRYIAYLWAEIPGFSKFGSYTGNGSADGPVVITGFRPRWIMFKCTSTNNGYTFWDINDTERNKYNALSNTLCANLSDNEDSGTIGTPYIDILSNGFKIRTTGSAKNLSGQTYVYAAFAETPSINLYGAQANAR